MTLFSEKSMMEKFDARIIKMRPPPVPPPVQNFNFSEFSDLPTMYCLTMATLPVTLLTTIYLLPNPQTLKGKWLAVRGVLRRVGECFMGSRPPSPRPALITLPPLPELFSAAEAVGDMAEDADSSADKTDCPASSGDGMGDGEGEGVGEDEGEDKGKSKCEDDGEIANIKAHTSSSNVYFNSTPLTTPRHVCPPVTTPPCPPPSLRPVTTRMRKLPSPAPSRSGGVRIATRPRCPHSYGATRTGDSYVSMLDPVTRPRWR